MVFGIKNKMAGISGWYFSDQVAAEVFGFNEGVNFWVKTSNFNWHIF